MILITLGTQDKQFKRLLDVVQKEIDKGNIKDKVVVQAGHTKYESKDMEIFDLIDREKFSSLISECDLLITHGGVGSIITGLQNNKKVIVAPRLAKYDEHLNDHQVQITNNFANAGYILPLYEEDDLSEVLEKVKTFKPKKFRSNTSKIRVKHYLKNLLIFFPLFFSHNLFNLNLLLKLILSFLSFCFACSIVYIVNDIKDRDKDKLHEKKKNRPIASGKISIKNALFVIFILVRKQQRDLFFH